MLPPRSLGGVTDIWNAIELRRLEYQEMQAIELFSLNSYVNQCGLLGPEDEHEDEYEGLSEEEYQNRKPQIDAVL